MIVVAGPARSGTSMQMIICRDLGLEISGEKVLKAGKDFNPDGIWEIPGVPRNGLNADTMDLIPEGAEVVKLTTQGLLKSEPLFITKLIYCIRDPREVIVSRRNQLDPASDDNNYHLLNVQMARLFDEMTELDWAGTHVVDYGDVMWGPAVEVNRLATYLEVEPTLKAMNAVRPELYRSKGHKAKRNKTAEVYYRELRRKI